MIAVLPDASLTSSTCPPGGPHHRASRSPRSRHRTSRPAGADGHRGSGGCARGRRPRLQHAHGGTVGAGAAIRCRFAMAASGALSIAVLLVQLARSAEDADGRRTGGWKRLRAAATSPRAGVLPAVRALVLRTPTLVHHATGKRCRDLPLHLVDVPLPSTGHGWSEVQVRRVPSSRPTTTGRCAASDITHGSTR